MRAYLIHNYYYKIEYFYPYSHFYFIIFAIRFNFTAGFFSAIQQVLLSFPVLSLYVLL
jgi:hypothetical protein